MSEMATAVVTQALKEIDESNGDIADSAAEFADEFGPMILRRFDNNPDLVDALKALADKLSVRRERQKVLDLSLIGR